MEKKQIISHLKSITNNHSIILTQLERDAIEEACLMIEKATTREQWLMAIQKLAPLLVELGSKILGP